MIAVARKFIVSVSLKGEAGHVMNYNYFARMLEILDLTQSPQDADEVKKYLRGAPLEFNFEFKCNALPGTDYFEGYFCKIEISTDAQCPHTLFCVARYPKGNVSKFQM
jgi:hypothetical protein